MNSSSKQKNRKPFELREMEKVDQKFIYKIIKDFLKSDLSVTFLKMPNYKEFEKNYFSNDYKRYMIIDSNNKKMGFVVITKDNEIGYFLSKKYQGEGIGVEAVKQLMQLNPRERYFATIHNKNNRSANLVKKLGFSPKATIYEKLMKEKNIKSKYSLKK